MENNNKAFAIYDETTKSLTFHKNNLIPKIGDIYVYTDDNGNIVEKQVTDVYIDIENLRLPDYDSVPWEEYVVTINYVEVVDKISPIDTSYWFNDFYNCEKFILNKLDVSNVKNMDSMFLNAGKNVLKFNLDLSNWNMSNVLNMSYMFSGTGLNATTFCLDLSNWNTSKTEDMRGMFSNAGEKAKNWNIKGLDVLDVSNVMDMSYMFYEAGCNADIFNLNLSNWNISNVKNMSNMFECAGEDATEFLLNLANWNAKKVKRMNKMFTSAGHNAVIFELNLANLNAKKVKRTDRMFAHAGYNAQAFNLNLTNWYSPKVKNMEGMFSYMGYKAAYSLDLSAWNVDKVKEYDCFNEKVDDKVIAPNWGCYEAK